MGLGTDTAKGNGSSHLDRHTWERGTGQSELEAEPLSPNVIARTLRPVTTEGWARRQGLLLPEPALLAFYDLTHQVSPRPVQPARVTTFPCCLSG